MAIGDVDRDGRPDLVRGNVAQPASLYLNAGGTFGTASFRTQPEQNTLSVALGDVDGDGRLDLVRGNRNQPATLYRNIGNHSDSTAIWTGPREETYGVALGDVDNDGDLDLVRGNFEQPATLYLNHGGVLDSTPAWTGPSENTYAVALGDVDGDGRLDMVRGNSGQTTLYLNAGGVFAPTPVWAGPEEETEAVGLGDVDGDGDLDLIRGNFGQSTTIYTNTGGTFAYTPSWTGPVEGTRSLALGDVDEDGDLDMVRGNNDNSQVVLLPTTLYLRKSPWIQSTGDTSRRNRLPNNAAYLRRVRVAPSEPNRFRISFEAFDAESDPLWLVGEYQLEGAALWHPMVLEGTSLRTGPFTTSRSGVHHEVAWDIGALPFDRRSVVIRLRADAPPRHAGTIQFLPSYLVNVGHVLPERPELLVSSARLDFSTITVGDSDTVSVTVSNPGTQTLVVDAIELPDTAITFQGVLPLFIAPGANRTLDFILALTAAARRRRSGADPQQRSAPPGRRHSGRCGHPWAGVRDPAAGGRSRAAAGRGGDGDRHTRRPRPYRVRPAAVSATGGASDFPGNAPGPAGVELRGAHSRQPGDRGRSRVLRRRRQQRRACHRSAAGARVRLLLSGDLSQPDRGGSGPEQLGGRSRRSRRHDHRDLAGGLALRERTAVLSRGRGRRRSTRSISPASRPRSTPRGSPTPRSVSADWNCGSGSRRSGVPSSIPNRNRRTIRGSSSSRPAAWPRRRHTLDAGIEWSPCRSRSRFPRGPRSKGSSRIGRSSVRMTKPAGGRSAICRSVATTSRSLRPRSSPRASVSSPGARSG